MKAVFNISGQFLYPGYDGPVTTGRLQMFRDGLEDIELFKMLPLQKYQSLVQQRKMRLWIWGWRLANLSIERLR